MHIGGPSQSRSEGPNVLFPIRGESGAKPDGQKPEAQRTKSGGGFLRGGSLPARGSGERCKFCEWGPGQSPGH